MRRLPSASEIAKKARELAMEAQARHMEIGDPITPTPQELKETGFTHEARIKLMQAPETQWEAEQRKYIYGMAEEMGLKIVTKKEYAMLQRIVQQPRNHKYVRNGKKPKHLKRKFAKTLKKRVEPKRVTLRKPLDIGSAIRGKPLPKIKAPSITDIVLKPRKTTRKRRRNRSQRVGRTMRKLRKPMKDGKKVFSFPDHIWKVRK